MPFELEVKGRYIDPVELMKGLHTYYFTITKDLNDVTTGSVTLFVSGGAHEFKDMDAMLDWLDAKCPAAIVKDYNVKSE